MKQFSCGDVVPGCNRTFHAATDDEIMTAVAVHAHSDHGMVVMPASLVDHVRIRILTA